MNKIIKMLFLCMGLFLVVFISACSNLNSYQRSIYHDEKKISKVGDSYTYKSKIGNVKIDELSFEIKGFYGKDTVWEMIAEEECTIDLVVSTSFKSGKFKLCLVSQYGVVSTIFEGSQEGTFSVQLATGTSRILMVGSNANGSITVDLSGDVSKLPVTIKPIQN